MSATDPPAQTEAEDMVYEIDASGGYLNSKEQDFIEDMMNMADANSPMTAPQRSWIERIWNRVCG